MGDEPVDAEMADDTTTPAPPPPPPPVVERRTSARRRASAASTNSTPNTATSVTFAQPPPPTASTVQSASRRSSLANLINEVDLEDEPRVPEVITVDSEDADEEDSDDSDESDEGEPQGDPEAGPVEEAEEDDDEDDSDDSEDDEDSDEDTDVPTGTPKVSAEAQPLPAPSPPPRTSISIADLTDNGVQGPPAAQPPTRRGISILLHPDPDPEPQPVPVQPSGIVADSSMSALTSPPTSLPPPQPDASTSAAAGEAASTATAKKSAKPKSTKQKRTPSPSPPPAPPPPPMQTIRLHIVLGGPSNYEVDIAQKAKETGQRPETPPPAVPIPLPDSEDERAAEAAADGEADGAGKKKKRKKKNAAQEYYDTSDPFIDDSELAVDQRLYFAQTKQQGFYVSSGEVALLKDNRSPKKPKSKKPGLSATLHSTVSQAVAAASAANGSFKHDPLAGDSISTAGGFNHPSPSDEQHGTTSVSAYVSQGLKGMGIPNGGLPVPDAKDAKGAGAKKVEAGWSVGGQELDDGDEKTGQKRKNRYITVTENGKKRKIVNITSFHPELQAAIEELKKSIAKESWEQKGKFPPALKPELSKLALLAIRLDEYDDHFFNLMPTLFPYNKFTMTKLIKRTVYTDHVALLQERQEQLLVQLQELAKGGFAKAEEEWEKSVVAWDKRQEKLRLEAANPPATADGEGGTGSAVPTRHPTEEKDGMDVDPPAPTPSQAPPASQPISTAGNASTAPGAAAHPPAKKYRLTEHMKAIIWDLVLLSNECCRLENEKNQYENSVIQVSEQGLRKGLYQKIVAAFPEGWMSSGQISRDVSAMKKRLEKEAAENE